MEQIISQQSMDWDTNGVNKTKLSSRITFYFIVIVSLSLTIGFFIFYIAVDRVTNQSAIEKMLQLNDYVAAQISNHSSADMEKQYPALKITELSPKLNHLQQQVVKEEKAVWIDDIHSYAYRIRVLTYHIVDGKHYQIVNNYHIVKIENKFWWSLIMVIAWIFVFVLIIIIFFGELISRNLYIPFHNILEQMKRFDVRKGVKIEPTATSIAELDELNHLIKNMADQSVDQYHLLKEFNENLSHELQTPLAHARGKIELLMDTELSEYQMQTLSVMYDELNRMTSLNKSLVILMGLEHYEKTDQTVNFSKVCKKLVRQFEDVIEMSGYRLELDIKDDVYIHINDTLLKIVLSNLISNAKRHNIPKGFIRIELCENFFRITNSGLPNELDEESVFKRFKKGARYANSLGIGLALVKKIVDIYGHRIIYKQSEDLHLFTIRFG